MPNEALRSLHHKYERMLAVRLGSAHLDARDVQVEMRRLSTRWPGALRELDRLTLLELEVRLAELGTVLDQRASEAPWMRAVGAYHGALQDALELRRSWSQTPLAFDARAIELGWVTTEKSLSALRARFSDRAGREPTRLALERVADALGSSVAEARLLVHPLASPRSHASRPGGA